MAHTFHLTIASVGNTIFDGEATSLIAPGEDGQLTILANHEPYVTPLKAGELHVEDAAGATHVFSLENKGILEVSQNQATVIV